MDWRIVLKGLCIVIAAAVPAAMAASDAALPDMTMRWLTGLAAGAAALAAYLDRGSLRLGAPE